MKMVFQHDLCNSTNIRYRISCNHLLRHSVCGDIELANGFEVGSIGNVVLEAENVRFQDGARVANGGQLSVINP